jgi:hypothetical protein
VCWKAPSLVPVLGHFLPVPLDLPPKSSTDEAVYLRLQGWYRQGWRCGHGKDHGGRLCVWSGGHTGVVSRAQIASGLRFSLPQLERHVTALLWTATGLDI